ncbi:MAG: hypothetical protein WBL63_09505 [Candidatus Acidiferrum sp.]
MQRLLQVHALRQVGAAELGVGQGIVGIKLQRPLRSLIAVLCAYFSCRGNAKGGTPASYDPTEYL